MKKLLCNLIVYLFVITLSLTITLKHQILKLRPRNANTIYNQVIVPMALKLNPNCRKDFDSKSCQETVHRLMMKSAKIWYEIDHNDHVLKHHGL